MILNFVLGNQNSAKLRSASVTVISPGLGQCRHARTNVSRQRCASQTQLVAQVLYYYPGHDRFDPCLSIAGGSIQYLDDGDFKYLGRLLNTTASEISSRTQLQAKLKTLLSIVDDSLLPGTSRLWLYHHFVVPKLSWAFLTLDLTLTFVKKLQAMAVAFLKKWSGLPHCANTAILFVGDKRRPGLKVHNLCTFWKQQQGVKFELLRKSLDPRCRKLHDIILARQGKWKRRFAPAVEVACATTVVDIVENARQSHTWQWASGHVRSRSEECM